MFLFQNCKFNRSELSPKWMTRKFTLSNMITAANNDKIRYVVYQTTSGETKIVDISDKKAFIELVTLLKNPEKNKIRGWEGTDSPRKARNLEREYDHEVKKYSYDTDDDDLQKLLSKIKKEPALEGFSDDDDPEKNGVLSECSSLNENDHDNDESRDNEIIIFDDKKGEEKGGNDGGGDDDDDDNDDDDDDDDDNNADADADANDDDDDDDDEDGDNNENEGNEDNVSKVDSDDDFNLFALSQKELAPATNTHDSESSEDDEPEIIIKKPKAVSATSKQQKTDLRNQTTKKGKTTETTTTKPKTLSNDKKASKKTHELDDLLGFDLNDALSETPSTDEIARSLRVHTGGMIFHVSSAINNLITGHKNFIVVLENHPKFWWFKNEFITCRVATMKERMTKSPFSWMDTNVTFNRRGQEHGPNNYSFRQNGGVNSLIRFVITIQSDSNRTIKDEMRLLAMTLHKMFTGPTVELAAKSYVECIRIAMPAFLKKIGKVDRGDQLLPHHIRTLEEQAANGLRAMTSTPATINYDMPLDKFFMDSDIKTFLTDCGYDSWGTYEETEEERFKIYKSGVLKGWDEIAYVPY